MSDPSASGDNEENPHPPLDTFMNRGKVPPKNEGHPPHPPLQPWKTTTGDEPDSGA